MNYAGLLKAINAATTQLQGRAAAAVNQALVLRNWMVGAYLVEFEQRGEGRAKYGARLLERLAADIAARGGKGLDARTLRDCRVLFERYPQIRGTVSPKLLIPAPRAAVRSRKTKAVSIRGTVSPELPPPLEPPLLLQLSWAKLQELIRIDDSWKRAFYENECLKAQWSVRQLRRQVGSLLYERTGLSTRKKAVVNRARSQAPRETIVDLLRDPYILEFTGLADRPEYSEQKLETVLLDHLQHFLLELGRGFCFEARQFRMTEGRKHHRVDLVFYHRLLRCHVLIDLKVRAFQPADAGQMNFYVNWCKANMGAQGDNPPIGILLCSDRDGAEVAFATAGLGNKLFVSRYLTALPSAAKLRTFLEADRERVESRMGRPRAARTRSKRAKAK